MSWPSPPTTSASASTTRAGRFAYADKSGTVVAGEITLPSGATRATLKKRQSGVYCVEYRLPSPAAAGRGESEPAFEVQPRRDLMPGVHKLYGDPTWPTYHLARTTFENFTDEPVR